jgi:hypothetical protein
MAAMRGGRKDRHGHLQDSAERRRIKILLACLGVIYFLSINPDPVTTSDDRTMLASAVHFSTNGSFSVPPSLGKTVIRDERQGRDGKHYPVYGIGWPLAMQVPLQIAYLAGPVLGPEAADFVLCLVSPVLILLTVHILYRTALLLDLSSREALWLALAFGIGSPAWVYASINFSEPLQMCLVAVILYFLTRSPRDETARASRFSLVAGGFAMGSALLTKASLGIFAPVFCVYVLASFMTRRHFWRAVRSMLYFAVSAGFFAILILFMNYSRYGTALDFGYGLGFWNPLWTGVYGLLVGPNKGVIFFAPAALLAPIGFWLLWGRRRLEAALLAACSVICIAFVATWWAWEGGASWGPRLILPALPMILLLSAAGLRSPVAWRAGQVLVLAGAVVNFLGVAIHYQSYHNVVRSLPPISSFQPVRPEFNYRVENGVRIPLGYLPVAYLPVFSQIPGHAWLLFTEAARVVGSRTDWWTRPPWIGRYPEHAPPVYDKASTPILSPWPLRLLFTDGRERGDTELVACLMRLGILHGSPDDFVTFTRLVERARNLAPASGTSYCMEGIRYMGNRDYFRARERFERAVSLDPDSDAAHYGLGLAYQSIGDFQAARIQFEWCLSHPAGRIDRAEVIRQLSTLPSVSTP